MSCKDYSRRQFLQTFGGTEEPQAPMYGPGQNFNVSVIGIVFLDAQSNQVNLSGNQTVPVHTSFVMKFSGLINVASVAAAISFIDLNNIPIAFITSSDQNAQYSTIVTLTPTADLLHNTNYALSIDNTATDSYGNKLIINANASATFKTVT